MKEPVKNIPASILARLKTQSTIMQRPFAEILQYYAMERFLYRLSRTRYAEKFVLKGGLLFYVWNLDKRRPTRDIDFRGYVPNDSASLSTIIMTIMGEIVPEDGITFDLRSVSVEETQIDADYQGVRVKLNAHLERTRIPVQIDIGFSDALVSNVEAIDYPGILPELKNAQLKGYPKESVAAEKFHAVIRHAELNSRMKDYYDLWLLAETFEFEGYKLQKGIETTFKKRETSLPLERPVGLTTRFGLTNQARWGSFLKKANLETNGISDFALVIDRIWAFLQHPVQTSIKEQQSSLKWHPNTGWN